jgi:uncharacterized damage-inducible protein DinB
MPISKSIADLSREFASTRRMLERYPDGRGAYRPHPKSRSLSHLATHVASIPKMGTLILTTDHLDFAKRPPVANVDSASELLALFDKAAAEAIAAAESAGEATLEQPWSMGVGDHVVAKGTKGEMVRQVCISHMIHHRAQLGDCYRLLDLPVPGMYGPSADDA